jgi:hypothetical protein
MSKKPCSRQVSWAREELNLRPLPCQQTGGKRCADRRSRRSPPTVSGVVYAFSCPVAGEDAALRASEPILTMNLDHESCSHPNRLARDSPATFEQPFPSLSERHRLGRGGEGNVIGRHDCHTTLECGPGSARQKQEPLRRIAGTSPASTPLGGMFGDPGW